MNLLRKRKATSRTRLVGAEPPNNFGALRTPPPPPPSQNERRRGSSKEELQKKTKLQNVTITVYYTNPQEKQSA